MSIPTELRMRLLQALGKDRGDVCLAIIGAIGDHLKDPGAKQRALELMRREKPTVGKVWKHARQQGDLGGKFCLAISSKTISDEELVAAADELVQGDSLSESALEGICRTVLDV